MSAKVCGLIWEIGPSEKMARFVLLAIADNATDDGFAYPGITLLAKKTLFSERHVMRAIQKLESDGWLTVERKAKNGKGSHYHIDVERLESLKDESRSRDKVSRDICAAQSAQVTSETNSGDICDNPPNPLFRRTVIETSGIPQSLFSEQNLKPEDSRDALKPTERAERGIRTVLFPYYQEVCDRVGSYTLTAQRLKKGADRFLECLEKSGGDWQEAGEMFRSAIDALVSSDFHMGRDVKTNGKRYCDWIDNLCKSAEQFEKWLTRAEEGQ